MSADASDAKKTMSMSAGNLGLPFRHKIEEKQDQIYEHHRSTIKEHVEGLCVEVNSWPPKRFLVTKSVRAASDVALGLPS
jgi:hypothetical protein